MTSQPQNEVKGRKIPEIQSLPFHTCGPMNIPS